MIDLSGIFSEASKQASRWKAEAPGSTASKMKLLIAGSTIDWDQESGEEWVRILKDGSPIIHLWTRFPIAFIIQEYASLTSGSFPGLYCITVEDFSWKKFSVDGASLKQMLQGQELSEQFNPRSFSAEDLWWATI